MSVTTVDPAVVEVSPPTSFVRVDRTTRLDAAVRSRDGALLSGRTVTWRSLQPAIAEVDEAGNVLGRAPGTATIEASAEGVIGTAQVTVTSGPAIQLVPDTVEFTAISGGASPGDRTVAISNPGDGTLGGLGVEIDHGAGPAGWLAAQLAATTAPTTLVLSAMHGGLAVGTHTASVRVTSAAASNSPATLIVKLTVLTPQPAIALGATAVTFTAPQGGANPAPQSVAVTNAGGGTLSGLGAAVSYTAGQPTGWLTAELGSTTAPTNLVLRAATGSLPAGSYTATVSVASSVAQNSPRALTVTFTVTAPQPMIQLSPAALAFTATQGESDPESKTVEIGNAGGGTLGQLAVEVAYPGGQPSGWLGTALSGTTAPATLTVSAAPGVLAPGTYGATVRVTSPQAANSPQLVQVSLEVKVPPIPGAPAGLTATPVSPTRIDLAWSAGSGTADAYRIERRLGDGAFALLATVDGGALAYQDTGLAAGTRYEYRVQACNVSGCSDWSATASATTSAVAPSSPSNLTATAISESEILLTWQAAEGALVYEIQRRRGNSGNWDFRTSVPATETQYLDGGLNEDTRYQYQVRACAGDLCSSYSNTATATTLD